MVKRRVLSGRDVCDILAAHGFIDVRQRGSHCVMQRETGGVTVTVPVPLHPDLRRGTLASIIRQSGLPKTLFDT